MGAFWYLLTSLRASEKADYEYKPELLWASIIVLILGAIIVPLIERIGDKKDKDKDEDRKEKK
jgi:hypothetical protein